MKHIFRTTIIVLVALAVVGLTYAANQAGLFQNIGFGGADRAGFEQGARSADGSTATRQGRIRPGPGPMEAGGRGMGRGGEGGEHGMNLSQPEELIKSLGIVAAIVALFVLGQRLWMTMRGPRAKKKLGAVG